MILSDRDILRRMEEGDLVVDPVDDLDTQLQPASLDLRLGEEFLEFQRTNISCIHPNRAEEVGDYVRETTVPEGEEFILHPGDFVLGTTKERVDIPDDLIATVQGRSSLGRLAVVIHATAGIVDPGYKGQLIFTELSSAADRPYGVDRDSKYQNQEGPQASRIGVDPEFSGEGE